MNTFETNEKTFVGMKEDKVKEVRSFFFSEIPCGNKTLTFYSFINVSELCLAIGISRYQFDNFIRSRGEVSDKVLGKLETFMIRFRKGVEKPVEQSTPFDL